MERASVRHNFLALGLDYSCFLIGMSFASQATVLPAFAAHLGASNVVIGAIPAVLTLGWFLPSLVAAHHTERLERKLPFVLRYTVWERVPMLALAAVAFFLADPSPRLALGVFFALILLMTGTGGTLSPAWMDVIGRAIPTTLRGRFFGATNVVAAAGGLLGSVLVAWFLTAVPPPRSYALCFLAAFVFLAVSYVALASAREPAGGAAADPIPLTTYLRRTPALLRRDANLRWFLVARAFGIFGTMANGFFTVYGLHALGAHEWHVGAFTTVFLAGQVVGNLALGWLADRAGHRLVLVLGLAAQAAGAVVAVGAASAEALAPVFALVGIHQASVHVSARTILLEFAEDVAQRPTYIGLGNTALAPVSFAGPLAAGLVADHAGFTPIFGLAAATSAIAIALLLVRVREPRS
ncbi:MAG TPA: MFS transporter [Methylomirabilota bacterium]|nr:MFS transporter [Methylomirabilota bacterium]